MTTLAVPPRRHRPPRLDARPALRRRLRRRLPPRRRRRLRAHRRSPTSPATHHHTLLIFAVNPLHNVIHLVLAVVWLAAAPRHRPPGGQPRPRRRPRAWSPSSASSAAWACSACPASPTPTTSCTWPPPRSPCTSARSPPAAPRTPRTRAPDPRGPGVTAAMTGPARNTRGTRRRDTRRGVHRPETTRHPRRKQDDGTVNANAARLRDGGPTPTDTVRRLPWTPATPPGSSPAPLWCC